MTHEQLKEALPAFALGALDPAEQAEVSAHVATCAECSAELVELGGVVNAIGLEASPVTPPAALRARVLGSLRDQPQASGSSVQPPASAVRAARSMWTSGLALAASLMLAAAASLYAWTLHKETVSLRASVDAWSAQSGRLREELAELRRESVTLRRAMDVIKAPDVLRVDLKGQDAAGGAAGRAYWSRVAGVMFTADRLPALPPGRVYQLWTIRGATPTSEGVFTPDGSGVATLTSPVSSETAPDAFGVTIEPAGGSTTPTLPIVLIGKAQ